IGACSSYAQITGVEYFFDTDPGADNGLLLPIQPGDTAFAISNLDLSSVGVGFHTVCFRSVDSDGRYGPAKCQRIYIYDNDLLETVTNEIVVAEYFFGDVDPGLGSAIPLPVTPGTTIQIEELISIAGLTADFQKLKVRVKDSQGQWSPVVMKEFGICCNNQPPTANFDFIRVGPNFSYIDMADCTANYSWSFGDGNSSTLSNPTHTYATPGAYHVVQTVTNPCGTTSFNRTAVYTGIEDYNPKVGGDGGYVSVHIYGGFTDSVTVWLSKAGEENIFPLDGYTNVTGNYLVKVIFDLKEKSQGSWTMNITMSNGESYSFVDGFEIEPSVVSVTSELVVPDSARLG
ncbi:MAG: PKD domain-containing protein, partial [Flavobacteriales bacterium]|nr:PKD domain-containing protein [Flavobacteriales bacterium]